jgi:hypothetical protein
MSLRAGKKLSRAVVCSPLPPGIGGFLLLHREPAFLLSSSCAKSPTALHWMHLTQPRKVEDKRDWGRCCTSYSLLQRHTFQTNHL